MGEINEKEQQLKDMVLKMTDQEEDMKQLTMTREKYRLDRDYLIGQLTESEK